MNFILIGYKSPIPSEERWEVLRNLPRYPTELDLFSYATSRTEYSLYPKLISQTKEG